MQKLWRYTIGRKGVNRVTVFERLDATSLFIEWWDDDGRHKKALSTLTGHPITDKDLAKQVAHKVAERQEQKRNRQGAESWGIRTDHTLPELFARRHADLWEKWSPKYRKDREHRRKFWEAKLGDIRLTGVNAAVVEKIARDAQGSKSERWRQDVLRYVVDSFIYARRKLKWITEQHDLSAVAIPPARGKSLPYTLEEARELLPALWDVHPVAGWIGMVAFQTGRRLTAIRTLPRKRVEARDGLTLIRFPSGTDKARNSGEAVVVGLPERTDWTVPSQEQCNRWIREAEDLAHIGHVSGRAWHGLKRLYATLTTDLPGADKQAGTRKETLDGHYRQDVIGPKKALAEQLAGRLESDVPRS